MPSRPTRHPLHLLAATVVVALVAVTVHRMVRLDEPWPDTVLGLALIAAGGAALYWRRRWPVPVALVTLVCAALYYPTSTYDSPLPTLAYVVALYTVAAGGRLVAAVTLAVLTMLAVGYGETVTGAGERRHVDDVSMFLLAGWLFGVVAAGQAQHNRQAYLREVEQRALAAEREKEVRARQSATEERLRIARELHDAVGHHLSLISVQAGAALHRHAKRPARPGDVLPELVSALETARTTSKDALRELRATLGLLRQVDAGDAGDGGAGGNPGGGEGGVGTAPPGPVPGSWLDQVRDLVERARTAGIDARLETAGFAGRLVPSPVGLAAYRIVQESLTNVVRHADARHAVVTLRCEGDDVRVRIEDDGHGAPAGADADGSGIAGMAERARALGGELTARTAAGRADGQVGVRTAVRTAGRADGRADGVGNGSRRGFRVEARLPLRKGDDDR